MGKKMYKSILPILLLFTICNFGVTRVLKTDLPASGHNKVAYYAFDATPKNQGVLPLTTFTDKANIVVVFEGTLWELADSLHYNTGWMKNAYYKNFSRILSDIQALRKKGIKVLMNVDDTKAWSTVTPFITHDGTRLNYQQFAAFIDSCLTLVGLDGISLDIEHGATDNSNYRELLAELGKYVGPLSKNNSTKRIYTAAIYKSSYGVPGPTAIGWNRAIADNFNFIMDMGYFQDNNLRFRRWADSLGNSKVMIGFSHDDPNNSLGVAASLAAWHPTPDKAGVMVFAGNVNKLYTDSIFSALDASFPNSVANGNKVNSAPQKFVLLQNYPNPFNGQTSIGFEIPSAGRVELELYDIMGRKIKTLLHEQKNAGQHSYNLTENNLASGTYIVRLKTSDFSKAIKLLLMK